MFFYPLDFTFVCPTELKAFNERYDEIKKAGAEIVERSRPTVFSAIVPGSIPLKTKVVLAQSNTYLASDITKDVSRDYGVLLEDKGIALRGFFIIDPEGVLQYQVVHSLNIGRSVDETLRVFEAIKTGGLCGANWKPRTKAIDRLNKKQWQ